MNTLPSRTIFLSALWLSCRWLLALLFLMISWPLIIILNILRTLKLGIFFCCFWVFFLGFRSMSIPRHIDYYSWCVLVNFSLFFLPKFPHPHPSCLYLWLNISHETWEVFGHSLFKSFSASFPLCFSWDLLPVCLGAWQYSPISEALSSFLLCFSEMYFLWIYLKVSDSSFCHLKSVAESI